MQLIIGGARSGKSSYAQTLAMSFDKVIYIATATRIDDSMSQRIEHHIASRPTHWQTIEEPLNLCDLLASHANFEGAIIIDCLTLWLNNHLYHYPTQDFSALFHALKDASKKCQHLFIVTNEVGLGVIPMGEISQQFVDESGRMNQIIANAAEKVTLMVAGQPMTLKET